MLRLKKTITMLACLGILASLTNIMGADVFAMKSELAGQHPRIVFTASEAAALNTASMTDMFIRLDRTLTWKNAGTYSYNSSYADAGQQSWWYGAGAAIYAAMTRSATDIANAKDWFTDLNTANWGYTAETTIGLNTAHYVAAYALIYDCLYNDLTEFERTTAKSKLVQAIEMFHSRGYESGAGGAAAYWLNDYQNNHMHFRLTGSLFALIAVWGEVDDDLTMYADNIIKYFRRLDGAIAPDGSNHEGFNYGHYGHALLSPAVYAYHRCIDTGTSNELVSPAYNNAGWFGIYMMTPDWKSCFGFGDSGNGPSDNLNYLYHCATELGNPYIQKGVASMNAAMNSNFTKTPQWSLLFKDSSIPQGDLNDIPMHRYFYDQGVVTCRASWDDADATAFAFKCGPMGGKLLNDTRGTEYSINTDYINVAHDDPDAGSFLMYTKSSMLSTGDYYEKTAKITKQHSTIQVDGATQYGAGGGWSQPKPVSQWAWQRDFASGGELVTFAGDMKGVYSGMDKLDRTFASMKANYAVIYDALESASGGRAYDWRMQSASTATHADQGSNTYQVTNGTGSALVKKLAPSTGSWAVESYSGSAGDFKSLHCNITGQQDQKFLVFIAPNATDMSMITEEYTSGTTMGAKVSLNGKTEYVLFADANSISAGDVTATAKTALTSAGASGLEYAAASNASALTYDGTDIMSSDTPINFGADYSAGAANGGQFRVRAATGSDTASGATVTIGNLAASTSYPVTINGVSQGSSSSDANGKLAVSVDLDEDQLIIIGNVSAISTPVRTGGAPGITLGMEPVVTSGKISLHTSVAQDITVRLLGADGRHIGTLADGFHAAGRYTLETDSGRHTGVHFLEVNGSLYKVILAK